MLMRIPRRFWSVTFDQITPELREAIRSYCKKLDQMLDEGNGFLLWGPNGHGKTSAAAFVAKEVRRTGASVLMVTARSLTESVVEKTEVDAGELLIERAREVDFLLLDDLGKEIAKDWAEGVLENLLRERCAAKRTTFITTNMLLDKMRQRYNVSLLEVLKESVVPLHVEGVNRRDQAQEDLRQAVGV